MNKQLVALCSGFKIRKKKYLITKILAIEASHEPTADGKIFHFGKTILQKSQPIFDVNRVSKNALRLFFH